MGALSSLLILRVLVKPRRGGLRHDLSPAEIKGSSPRLSAGFLGVSYHLRVLQESFQSHDEAGRRCLYQASVCTYLFSIGKWREACPLDEINDTPTGNELLGD